jgi:hypothetical protein
MVLPILASAIVGACGSQNGSGFFGGGDGSANGGSSGSTLGGGTTPNCSDTSAGDLRGCGCSAPTRACWTVPNDLRNTNGCSDGKQTCTKTGEFSSWGACAGEVTSCYAGGKSSGGTASSSGSTGDQSDGGSTGDKNDAGGTGDQGPPGCVCVPGAYRWCDTPVACNWGKQQCKPDGQWGPCNETPDRPPGCNDPTDPSYDEDCCVQAGQCCQDLNSVFDDQKSIGKCDGIACKGQFTSR